MIQKTSLSPAAMTHVVSMVVACAGFLILLAAGVPEFQPFPPGVVVLLAASVAVVSMPHRRWVPLIGVGLCLAVAIGAFLVYEPRCHRRPNSSRRADRDHLAGYFDTRTRAMVGHCVLPHVHR